MTELHLTDEQLASLVDDSTQGTDRALLVEHLRSCEHCQLAHREAVRYRAMMLADASIFRVPDDALRAARRIARPTQRAEGRAFPGFRWLISPGVLAGLTAAVIVIGAVGLWQAGFRPFGRDYERWFQPLQQAAVSASEGGSIVLPGTENAGVAAAPLHRSGYVEPNPAIESALDELTLAYRNHPDPDVAHWLITGCLVTGNVERASIYIDDARLRFPEQTRFVVLDAIVAYRSDDMAKAERLLQYALEDDPHNGAALLNLALVQYEMGHEESARRTLELVRSEFPGSPLEARAAALISDLLKG